MYFELQVFQKFLIYSSLILLFTVGRMLKILPFFKSMISIAMCKMTDTSLPTEIYWDSLFTWKMLQNVYYCLLADMGKKVKLNNKAYNSPIVSIDGQRCQRILDFAKGSRPLVLNFGSSTCPVFMQMLKRYQLLMKEFQEMADFAVIYIEEAHPVDGWAFKVKNQITLRYLKLWRMYCVYVKSKSLNTVWIICFEFSPDYASCYINSCYYECLRSLEITQWGLENCHDIVPRWENKQILTIFSHFLVLSLG